MLGDQDQRADNGATAVQGGRDVTLHQTNNYGLSVAEVRTLSDVFVREHLPMLREVAQQEAQRNAQVFVEKFLAEVAAKNDPSLLEKLQRPSAQAVFTEATIGAAKRGESMDLDVLAKLVVQRLESPANSLIQFVSEEAASVLPRLSSDHLLYLGFMLVTGNLVFQDATDVASIENRYMRLMNALAPGTHLSEGHRDYLAGLGLLNVNFLAASDNFLAIMKAKYAFITDGFIADLPNFPSLAEAYDAYKRISIPPVNLTATGKCVGALVLQRILGAFDIGIFVL